MVLIDYEKKEEVKEDAKGPHKPGANANAGGASRNRPGIVAKKEEKKEEAHEEKEKKEEEKEEVFFVFFFNYFLFI